MAPRLRALAGVLRGVLAFASVPQAIACLRPSSGRLEPTSLHPNQAGSGIQAHGVRSDLQHGRLPTITIGHPFASRFPVHPLWLTQGIPLVGSSVAIACAVLAAHRMACGSLPAGVFARVS